MKTILTMIIMVTTFTSAASFAGYSDEQLRYERQCSVKECKAGDGNESMLLHVNAYFFYDTS